MQFIKMFGVQRTKYLEGNFIIKSYIKNKCYERIFHKKERNFLSFRTNVMKVIYCPREKSNIADVFVTEEETDTQTKIIVAMEAKLRVLHLPAKECQGLPATPKLRKRHEMHSTLEPVEKSQASQHLDFRLPASTTVIE